MSDTLSDLKLVVSSRDYFGELVEDGLQRFSMPKAPQVHSYIVDLLEFYLSAQNLHDEPVNELGQRQPQTLAELYLSAGQEDTTAKIEKLKKVGDRSLYIAGFFGDSLKRKIIDIDYYADIGGAAYSTLAQSSRVDIQAHIYRIFAHKFLGFVDVLSYVNEKTQAKPELDLLRLYDRYQKTGSEHARQKLVELGALKLTQDTYKKSHQD